jgi:hypothetical protein
MRLARMSESNTICRAANRDAWRGGGGGGGEGKLTTPRWRPDARVSAHRRDDAVRISCAVGELAVEGNEGGGCMVPRGSNLNPYLGPDID